MKFVFQGQSSSSVMSLSAAEELCPWRKAHGKQKPFCYFATEQACGTQDLLLQFFTLSKTVGLLSGLRGKGRNC